MSSRNCTVCNCPNSRACASCSSAVYCSVECQQTDWSVHKTLCKTFKTFQSSTRPSSSSKLALLLPVDSKVPRLVWVECELQQGDEYQPPYEYSHVEHFLCDEPFSERKPIKWNVFRGFHLDHTVEVVVRGAFLIDGSKTNICVAALTRGLMHHDWRGPIVVLSEPGTAIDPLIHQDITLSDLRIAVDYFLTYGEEPVEYLAQSMYYTLPTSRPRGAKVQCVRINCLGDREASGAKQYVAVAVPRDHPVFQSTPTGISMHMGLPLQVRKCPPYPGWKGSGETHPHLRDNQAATSMNLNADMNSDRWAWAPPQWKNDVGSVIVAREDGKDLTPRQAEASAYYCQFKLQPVFEDSIDAGHVKRTREEVVSKFLTRNKFEEFFDKYKREEAAGYGVQEWLAEKSPYHV